LEKIFFIYKIKETLFPTNSWGFSTKESTFPVFSSSKTTTPYLLGSSTFKF